LEKTSSKFENKILKFFGALPAGVGGGGSVSSNIYLHLGQQLFYFWPISHYE